MSIVVIIFMAINLSTERVPLQNTLWHMVCDIPDTSVGKYLYLGENHVQMYKSYKNDFRKSVMMIC